MAATKTATPRPATGKRTRRRTAAATTLVASTALIVSGISALPATGVNTAQNVVVSATPATFTPHVENGTVYAIVQVGSKIVVAGDFTSVHNQGSTASIARRNIFAFNATTGVVDTAFNPGLDAAANSLDTDGTYVYVGGSFNTVAGKTARKVAKLTAAGALVTNTAGASPFPAPNGAVKDVVVRGGRLYVGGAFTTVGGTARGMLAALNKDSGALLGEVNVPFTGTYNGGTTNIKRFDISPDGRTLVAIGNFNQVGSQPREQIAMVDLPANGAATVSSWATTGYSKARNAGCADVFDTFMRDLDFAPDGSYFAVSSTGAFGGGVGSGTLCDTVTRWETNRTGAGQEPTWADYTGGDTTYGVAATGTAIYVGGHMRWENNPYQGDQAGPGAVPRPGIAALDPVNGLPLSWNPGRDRGVGAQALYATSQGLWVGSDTTVIAGKTHMRLALMPLAGGKAVPAVASATLPNDLFTAERTPGPLYRVNAGGPAQGDWADDSGADSPYRNSGSNTADWGGATIPTDATVPAGTPAAIFNTERWDPGSTNDGAEMTWHFPVPAGKQVRVRLYFANRYSGTATVGSRVFDVAIDNATVLDHFDIVAAVGDGVGTMREFPVTSDGSIDISFTHEVENPLINGIEIIDPTAVATQGRLLRTPVDATGTPTGPATPANTAMDWSQVRGAFLVNSTLYYGKTDGGLYARSFTKATAAVGTERAVNLYDDPDTGERIPFAIAGLTGMFYEPTGHRLYYTVAGDSHLYYRYFTPESEVVGALTFQADNGGVDLSSVAGMTLAGGRVLYGATDGALRTVTFDGTGITSGPTTVPTDNTWNTRAIFVSSS